MFVHVAVGDDDVVLNPTIRGNEFWPEAAFEYPGLSGYFVVPGEPDWTPFEFVGPRRLWHYIARAFGRNPRGKHTDCVTTVCDVLGMEPVLTPDELWDAFRSSGYEWCEMGGRGLCHAGEDPADSPSEVPPGDDS